MAVSQVSKSVRVIQPLQKPIFQYFRVQAGVVAFRSSPEHLGWRLVSAAVRRYRTLSPEARAIIHALAMAVALFAIFIRFVFLAKQ
jgi:hypothetical protein